MEEATILTIRDKNEKYPLTLELDWKDRHHQKVLKAKMGELEALLDPGDFWRVAFAISEKESQEKLIPTNGQVTRHFEKWYQIKATKAMKKGDTITTKVRFTIPEEVLDELIKLKQEGKKEPEDNIALLTT